MSKSKLPQLESEKDPLLFKKILIRFALVILILGLTFRYVREWQLVHGEIGTLPGQLLTADCGVVLTGSIGRVREGFDLLEQGQIQNLIISGVNPQNNIRDLLPIWPYYKKAQENFVFLEKRSETTYGNAVQSAHYVQALKCRDVVLITSELHMFRSYQTFRPVYPMGVVIWKHPVIAPRGYFSFFDSSLEVFKSLFYRPWAY